MNPLGSGRSWQSGIAILEDNVFEKKLLPEGSPLSEKRKATRVAVGVPLRFRVKGKRSLWQESESLDVSNTGIRLAMLSRVPIGTRVELDVILPNTKKNIRFEGVIVWIGPSPTSDSVVECGVAFENLRQLTRKKKLIYFIADRLCETAIKQTPADLECYPAQTLDELKAAYHLVYEEYIRRGYCDPDPSKMHYSAFCVFPDSRTFIMKYQSCMLGTISLIVDSPCGLPMEMVFKELISPLRNEGRRLAEVSLLALDHESFRKKSFSLTDFHKLTGAFRLFKVLFEYARYIAGVTDLLISVHPKHEDLYRYLSYEIMGPPRPYASACGKPGLPMRLDIQRAISNVADSSATKRYFLRDITPVDVLKKHFVWDRAPLREFLIHTNPVWGELPPDYREYLRHCYPDFEKAD
ncbi:MAG: PilZ domain-containing protein [Candidatus Omnitrophica bacterium]|nr:PilZ domain-containing protein [Candidatus Omnitrophota bacterium]